jgi:hypothetical protein
MASAKIEVVLAAGYLGDVAVLSLAEIRARRADANEVETDLSYLRRLVQGRLDIVLAEQQRRDAGQEPEDLAELVARLPAILGEHVHAPGLGRLPTLMAPGEPNPELLARLDAILAPDQLGLLHQLSDEALRTATVGLSDLEREVSTQRRAVHELLDRLQEEIIRRYQTGEANVDSLLR